MSIYQENDGRDGSRREVLAQFDATSPEIGRLARLTVGLVRPDEGDGIGVFLGLGETSRLASAVELWRDGAFKHLFIGGVNPQEQDHPSENELCERVEELGGTRMDDIHVLAEARHTKDQADWLASRMGELGVRRLVLVEPDYHLPRAYATTLASLNTAGSNALMWGSGINYPSDFVTPEPRYPGVKQTPVFMASEDARRIPLYQQTGDVASNEAWLEHLKVVEKT